MNKTSRNVVMCDNPEKGHFFDGDLYDKCPVCGYERRNLNYISDDDTKNKKQNGFMGMFSKKKKDTGKEPKSWLNSAAIPKAQEKKGKPGYTPTVALDPSELFEATEDIALDSEKEDVPESGDYVTEKILTTDIEDDNYYLDIPEDIPVADDSGKAESTELVVHDEPVEPADGLADVIKKASANSEGKTMSYFDSAKKTAGKEESRHIDPVAGWLVCVSGAHFGESFNIAAGMNSIGRSDSNRIVLDMDNSVSRDKHAFVTYEPRKRRFFVKPGDSSGLTYVNDEYITESIEVKAMDVVELGNSKFILIPLCGENFTWEDYISKE